MNKTSVYLDDDDIDLLRQLQQTTGKSQSELLREGIRTLSGEPFQRREPKSLGIGAWAVADSRRWDPDELAASRGLT